MGFSFSAKRRREVNRNLPYVRAMLAVADRYGPHSGSADDDITYVRLFTQISELIPDAGIPNVTSLAREAAKEAIHSTFPLPVHAAWAVASLFPNSTIIRLQNAMGMAGMTACATVVNDEFPGLVKTPVLGRRSALWRGPAAITVVLLAALADESGIRY